jgi:hypothetical protein
MGQPTAAAPGPRRLRFFEARNRRGERSRRGRPRGARRGHKTNPRAATPIAVPAVKTRSWEPSPRPRGPGPGDQLPGARFTKTIRHGQKRSRGRPGRGHPAAGGWCRAVGAGSVGRLWGPARPWRATAWPDGGPPGLGRTARPGCVPGTILGSRQGRSRIHAMFQVPMAGSGRGAPGRCPRPSGGILPILRQFAAVAGPHRHEQRGQERRAADVANAERASQKAAMVVPTVVVATIATQCSH